MLSYVSITHLSGANVSESHLSPRCQQTHGCHTILRLSICMLDFCQVSLSGDEPTFDYQCYKLPRVQRRLTFCAQNCESPLLYRGSPCERYIPFSTQQRGVYVDTLGIFLGLRIVVTTQGINMVTYRTERLGPAQPLFSKDSQT